MLTKLYRKKYKLKTYLCTMTQQEAQLFLKIENADDLQDRWDEELFDIKRFLLTSTPIPKVFDAKIARLKKYAEAYEELSGSKFINEADEIEEELVPFSEDVETAFHELHKSRTHFKQKLHSANNPCKIEQIITRWLILEGMYISKWVFAKSVDIPNAVIQSKELDPMDLLGAIKLWKNSVQSSTFQQLQSDFSFLPEQLRIEVKRLTLLSYYYGERLI